MTQVAEPVSQSTHQEASDHLHPFESLMEKRAAELQVMRDKQATPPSPEHVVVDVAAVEPNKPVDANTMEAPVVLPVAAPAVKDEKPEPVQLEVDDKKLLEVLQLEATPSATAPTEVVENIEEYKALASKYKALLEDKEIKAVLDAKKDGVSVFDFVKKIQGEDYSKLSAKELFELDLNNYNLDEDAKAIEREKFNGMLVSQQSEIGNKIKQGLDGKRGALLEQYRSNTDAIELLKDTNKQKAHQRLGELKEKKSFNNLEITAERWSKIQEYVEVNTTHNENYEYDVDKTYQQAIWALFGNEVILANVRKATTAGRMEVFKEVTRPDKESVTPTTTPPAPESKQDAKEDAAKVFREQQANQFSFTN